MKLHLDNETVTVLELYQKEGAGISYERFIKRLEKQVFIDLREKLGLENDLELPTRFFTFSDYADETGKLIMARFNYSVQETRGKVKKVIKTRIGCNVSYNLTMGLFIGNIAHEMVHYYDLMHNKKHPLYHRRKFKKIARKWNRRLKSYRLYVAVGGTVLEKIK